MIPRRDLLHAGADRLDHAGALVTEHRRQRHGIPLVANDQVGVADPARHDPDQHLVRLQISQFDRLDLERGALAFGYRSLNLHERGAYGNGPPVSGADRGRLH